MELTTADERLLPSTRALHALGALLFAGAIAIVISGGFGVKTWAKNRQRRAIQQSALADLKLVATAEETYFKKYGHYTTDLFALGLKPKAVLFLFGFSHPSDLPAAAGFNPETLNTHNLIDRLAATGQYAAAPELSPITGVRGLDQKDLVSLCGDCTANEHSFKVAAIANLDSDSDLDVWTIDQTGNVIHSFDDLKIEP